ncbi:major pollen allergen Ole e 10-like [Phalaenopsis equestris]|uniref:major pollen allergen Ole e 10-like n=1 Tax=Phalaenopsis equestris TaxID=78828 RepID=UPI0009E5D765|nr:major pollen allergen Ole e 10-like [Phalaenopsis equestris]
MATLSSLPVVLSLSLILFSAIPETIMVDACHPFPQLPEKTWCVANPSAKEVDLQNNIDFACSKIDCSLIQYDGLCFFPDTNISHASVAMNLYYQSNGRNSWNCYFGGSGLLVTTDPSYGTCKYEFF